VFAAVTDPLTLTEDEAELQSPLSPIMTESPETAPATVTRDVVADPIAIESVSNVDDANIHLSTEAPPPMLSEVEDTNPVVIVPVNELVPVTVRFPIVSE